MTIAQSLNVKEFPFICRDGQGREVYVEAASGAWERSEYGPNDKVTYWEKSNKNWVKRGYDDNGNYVYYENSNGRIEEYRPKPDAVPEQPKPIGKTIELTKEGALYFIYVDGKYVSGSCTNDLEKAIANCNRIKDEGKGLYNKTVILKDTIL